MFLHNLQIKYRKREFMCNLSTEQSVIIYGLRSFGFANNLSSESHRKVPEKQLQRFLCGTSFVPMN